MSIQHIATNRTRMNSIESKKIRRQKNLNWWWIDFYISLIVFTYVVREEKPVFDILPLAYAFTNFHEQNEARNIWKSFYSSSPTDYLLQIPFFLYMSAKQIEMEWFTSGVECLVTNVETLCHIFAFLFHI